MERRKKREGGGCEGKKRVEGGIEERKGESHDYNLIM